MTEKSKQFMSLRNMKVTDLGCLGKAHGHQRQLDLSHLKASSLTCLLSEPRRVRQLSRGTGRAL